MIYKSLLFAATLPAALAAGGMRRAQESGTSLGDLFLAAAKNVTNSTSVQYQKDSYVSAEVNGKLLADLSDEMHKVCLQLGYIESENQSRDAQSGETERET